MTRKPTLAAACLLLCLTLTAVSFAQKQPVTPESFHTLTWVGDPQWSPVDDRIVFTTRISNEKRDGYDANLWMVRADGSGLRQLTYAVASDSGARWSEDGKEILFTSSRGGSSQAWILPAEGGEARCVTNFPLDVADVRWIPGSRAISFVASVLPTSAAGRKTEKDMVKVKDPDLEKGIRVIKQAIYRAGKSYFEGKRPHLFTLDLASGEIRQLTSGEMSVDSYQWSPDGKRVVVSFEHLDDATDIGLTKIRLLDREGTWIRDLNDKPGYYGLSAWRPASAQVIVTQDSPEGFLQKIFFVSVDSGEWTQIRTGFDGDHGSWRWSRDGKRLFALTGEKGDVNVWSFDPESGQGKRITSGRRQIGFHSQMFASPGFTLSPDASRFTAAETMPEKPEELVVGSTTDGKTTSLTDINRNWRDAHKLIPAEKFSFKARDGASLDAWIIPPADLKPGEKRPLVLEIHGGPRTMYGEHFMQEFQMLAGMNMGVVYINPRGSTGYGEASTRATLNNWGGTPYTDLMDGVDAAIARYSWVDKDRLGVGGGSYGGYMTAWVIGHTDRFKAAIPMRGVYNFYSFPFTTDIPHFTEVEFGGLLWSNPTKHWEFSPMAYANKVKTPTLIIHSENDFRAPIPDAEQFYAALRLHGVTAEFVRYADEGHELSRAGRPDRRVDRLERIAAWFKRWLDPEAK